MSNERCWTILQTKYCCHIKLTAWGRNSESHCREYGEFSCELWFYYVTSSFTDWNQRPRACCNCLFQWQSHSSLVHFSLFFILFFFRRNLSRMHLHQRLQSHTLKCINSLKYLFIQTNKKMRGKNRKKTWIEAVFLWKQNEKSWNWIISYMKL